MDNVSSAFKDLGHALLLFGLGILLALGRLLQQDQLPAWNIIIGRSIVTGVLSLAAGSALAVIPNLSLLALLGIASVLSSMGTGALERLLLAIFRGKQ